MFNYKRVIIPVFSFLAVVALAWGISAFKTAAEKVSPQATTYHYTYVGAQTPEARKDGRNYINPQTNPFTCDGTLNECAVAVSVTGTPPANISSLPINYNQLTGFPEGGSAFVSNQLKD